MLLAEPDVKRKRCFALDRVLNQVAMWAFLMEQKWNGDASVAQ